jgi:hypothetical protein
MFEDAIEKREDEINITKKTSQSDSLPNPSLKLNYVKVGLI